MNKIPRLSTRRLILRPLALSDVKGVYDLGSREEVARLAGFPRHASPADARRYIAREIKERRKPGLSRVTFSILLKSGRRWIGTISLRWPHAGLGEIGYALHPDHWGRGYAPEAARKIADAAFARFDAHRVQATCWVKNRRSGRVLAKAGLRREGRLRGYLRRGDVVRDEFVWGMTRDDWRSSR